MKKFSYIQYLNMFLTFINSNVKNVKTSNVSSSNTLRNKNINQSRNIPSINYKVNGGYSKMSIPKDFVINNHMAREKEQIRKAG